MADRKQTPDILSEILSGMPASEAMSAHIPTSPAIIKSKSKPAPKIVREPRSKKIQFEYQVVSFQDYKGWRSRFINGKEVPNWMSAPLLYELIQERAREGWELISATSGEQLYGNSDKRQLFFKRLAAE